MDLDRFFQLLEVELHDNKDIAKYHRFVNDEHLYYFRKAYLYQRYQFLINSIEKPNASILDLGCGFGTTAILLTLLGHKVHGITLEYYFDQIEPRLKYWSQYGDCSNLTFEYADLFDFKDKSDCYDYVVAIDTLHHVEPIKKGLDIICQILRKDGKMVVSEENGHNWITCLKHIKERGFKRISNYYDERLKKTISFGNENSRSLQGWLKIISQTSFIYNADSLEYIRYYFPKSTINYLIIKLLKKNKSYGKNPPS